MVWGTPPDPRQGLRPLGTPGEPEGLVPSEPFEGGRVGCFQTYAAKH